MGRLKRAVARRFRGWPMMPELKPLPCPNDSIVEACKPWVEAIDGTNSKGLVGPCKFCGHSAWLQPYNEGRNYQSHNSHPTGISLQCSNSKCRATMHRNQCWVDDAHTALEAPQTLVNALLVRWNTRPDGGDSPAQEALRLALQIVRGELTDLFAVHTPHLEVAKLSEGKKHYSPFVNSRLGVLIKQIDLALAPVANDKGDA